MRLAPFRFKPAASGLAASLSGACVLGACVVGACVVGACVVGALFAPTAAQAQQRVLRLISDRSDQGTLRPLLDAFEARTGAKVSGVFLDQGLVNRLESRPTEADVVITKDAELLDIAARRGLLDTLPSAKISAGVPAEFMDPAGR